MTEETVAARTIINASADVVFDRLADPSMHMAIDGTGWVREPVEEQPLTEIGQVFRMGMYHDDHPKKHYEMANRVEVFERPRAIAWLPGAEARHIPGGQGPDDGRIHWGGWIWRYDLRPVDGDRTEVTLSFDWSAVTPQYRDIEFPPFELRHLDNSLRNLAALAERVYDVPWPIR